MAAYDLDSDDWSVRSVSPGIALANDDTKLQMTPKATGGDG